MITFEDDNGNNNFPVEEQIGYYANNLYPAKILCFVQGSDDSIHAVIHYLVAPSEFRRPSKAAGISSE